MSIGTSLLNMVPIVGPAISGAIQSGQSRKNVKDTIHAQYVQQERANQYNIDMWNRMNEYNTPAAQMQRFKDAGLNPHLIYGQGTAGNATALPKYEMIRPDYTKRQSIAGGALNALGLYQDFQLKNAQIDQVKANADFTDAKTATERVNKMLRLVQRGLATQKHRLGEYQSKYFEKVAKTEFDTMVQDLRRKRLAGDIQGKTVEWYDYLKSMGIAGQFIRAMMMFNQK